MSNPLQVADRDNELLREADEYLRKHKILELFEDLTTIICYKQPENLEGFLVDLLKQRKEQGNRSIVYNEAELQNIFTLYDRQHQQRPVQGSPEDSRKQRVPLHKGPRESNPRKGGPVHFHESLRRGARNQAPLIAFINLI